jgi:hypothetical protein
MKDTKSAKKTKSTAITVFQSFVLFVTFVVKLPLALARIEMPGGIGMGQHHVGIAL